MALLHYTSLVDNKSLYCDTVASASGKITEVAVLKPYRSDTDRVGRSAGQPLRSDLLLASSAGKC